MSDKITWITPPNKRNIEAITSYIENYKYLNNKQYGYDVSNIGEVLLELNDVNEFLNFIKYYGKQNNVQNINLSNCGFAQLSIESIASVFNNFIELSNNHLTEVNVTNVNIIDELNLSNNAITDIEFENCMITTIVLSENKIKKINFELCTVSWLFLDSNGLTNDAIDLHDLPDKISKLDLSKNNLDLNRLHKLCIIEVDLSGNVHPNNKNIAICNCSINTLNISNCGIIDFKFFNCAISELYLSNNLICSFPKLDILPNELRILDLSFCCLQNTITINNLTLNMLNLSHNKILFLTINNSKFYYLIASNNLSSYVAFNNNVETKFLDLSFNRLRNIWTLPKKVTKLILSNNIFECFPVNGSMSSITHLDLSSNNLRKIIWNKNSNITNLNVDGNTSLKVCEIQFNREKELHHLSAISTNDKSIEELRILLKASDSVWLKKGDINKNKLFGLEFDIEDETDPLSLLSIEKPQQKHQLNDVKWDDEFDFADDEPVKSSRALAVMNNDDYNYKNYNNYNNNEYDDEYKLYNNNITNSYPNITNSFFQPAPVAPPPKKYAIPKPVTVLWKYVR